MSLGVFLERRALCGSFCQCGHQDCQSRTSGLPVQGAFLNRVHIAEGQDAYEGKHTPEYGGAVLHNGVLIDHRPRVHENDLQIEQDEEHRDEVELDAETGLRSLVGDHTALIRGVLGGIPAGGFSEQEADQQGAAGKTDGHEHLQENGKIITLHNATRKTEDHGRRRSSGLENGPAVDRLYWVPTLLPAGGRGEAVEWFEGWPVAWGCLCTF